jgi:hypothetical protein
MDTHILTECFVDTLLAETLSTPNKGYNHQHSCNNVLKTMRGKFSDKAALGIIDDDKVISKEFLPYSLLKKHNEHLAIYKHNEKAHYVIKIGKAAEDFIINAAQRCGILLSDYNLPTDLDGLKKRTKHRTDKKDMDLQRLFSILKQNRNSDFYKLAQWIENFKNNPYHFLPDSE